MTSGTGADAGIAAVAARPRRLMEPSTALIAAAVLLPCLLFGLAAWQSYNATLRAARTRVERTARVLEEHALKVFETDRLVIQNVNSRLRSSNLGTSEGREELRRFLQSLQGQLAQVATISVADRDGVILVSNRAHSFDQKISVADRDWFVALSRSDAALPFVSRAYLGRQSGMQIFNVAGRVQLPSARGFAGAIAVSADRAYFERFYETVEPTLDHSVLLVREDGCILARVPATDKASLPTDSPLLAHIAGSGSGLYRSVSRVDGVDRFIAYRKVGAYPVYVRFGLSVHTALAPWRASLLAYGLVAALASLALVGASILAIRQTERERVARKRWEETAAALSREAAERGRVEDQLRQSQKMEAVGRLTGGLAHDFNNLLTAVIGSLDLIRHRRRVVDAQTLDLVGSALEGAKRAAALTSRLLAFARRQPLESVRVDVTGLVAGMSDLLRRTLGDNITIKTSFADGLWPTLSDPNQLESAILNLAVNARDAMPDGGLLTIATANVHVAKAQATGLPAGDHVCVSVADTGTGMSPEVIANIFEPFFTTKPAGRGTGLGLSQVYGFVRQSGGRIDVRSTPGQGTTFLIHLPRLLEEAAEPSQPQTTRSADPVPRRRGRGETILVVEDEPMVLRLTTAMLEDAGYRVVAATDGRSGFDMFGREPDIALLLTDVVLGGGMNGRVLADAILRTRPDLPVLFTSGYSGDALVHDGRLDAGVVLLAKPFTAAALLDRVTDLIARHEHGRMPLVAL